MCSAKRVHASGVLCITFQYHPSSLDLITDWPALSRVCLLIRLCLYSQPVASLDASPACFGLTDALLRIMTVMESPFHSTAAINLRKMPPM